MSRTFSVDTLQQRSHVCEEASAPRTASTHLARFDITRSLAAAAVVWIHAASHVQNSDGSLPSAFGRFAVPFFTITAIFFAVGSAARRPNQSWSSNAMSRVTRLYLPFVAWSGIYIVARAVQGGLHADSLGTTFGLPLLYNGGAYHLWFLPFLLVVLIAVFPLAGLLARRPGLGKPIVLSGVVIGLVLSACPTPESFSPEKFFLLRMAWPQLAGVAWGVALAAGYYGSFRRQLDSPLMRWVGAILAVVILIAPSVALWERTLHLVACLSGLGFFLWSLGPSASRWLSVWKPLGKQSYGIYLCHVLFIGALRGLPVLHGHEGSLAVALFVWAISLLAAAALTTFLSRVQSLAWLVT